MRYGYCIHEIKLTRKFKPVDQIIEEREEASISATKTVVKNTTPVVNGMKKRRKSK